MFINPGSITGAYSATQRCVVSSHVNRFLYSDTWCGSETTPSFLLMDIQGHNVVTYVYRLIGDELKVEKLSFKKAE